MIQIEVTDIVIIVVAIVMIFLAWYEGRDTEKLLKRWREEDERLRQEWQNRMMRCEKQHENEK